MPYSTGRPAPSTLIATLRSTDESCASVLLIAHEPGLSELIELLEHGGFRVDGLYGVFHGPRLRALDAKHGGSIIDAQITRALADAPWPADLLADVAGVTTDDFELRADGDIDASLDLVAIAVRP